ncbi:MAG: hypothetical protein KDB53_01495 [Planctomycetes bacterium]|nr:hypothetical protein [Planctomycetota bacterium]
MSAAKAKTKSSKILRRQYLVDREMQIGVIVSTAGMFAFIGLLCGLAGMLLPGDELFGRLSGQEIRTVIVSAIAVFFVMGTLVVGAGAMFFTHRVAGPTLVIERALNGMARDDFQYRLKLRTNDHLKPLAAATTRLSLHMQDSLKRRNQLIGELDRLLSEGDLDSMRSLVTAARQSGAPRVVAPAPTEPAAV